MSGWLHEPVRNLGVVLRRLGAGLHHCYHIPGLPRPDNALELLYRRVKTEQRRITGCKRPDAFVVRVGGLAVYATASSGADETVLCQQLAIVPAVDWQQQRLHLRQTQARQTKMRRFRLRRAAYLNDLEEHWTALTLPRDASSTAERLPTTVFFPPSASRRGTDRSSRYLVWPTFRLTASSTKLVTSSFDRS